MTSLPTDPRRAAAGDRLMLGQIERLIRAFGARGKANQSVWKLDVLMELGSLDDQRVVTFLTDLADDAEEPTAVRIDALQRLRQAPVTPGERGRVVAVTLGVLRTPADLGLRLHAAPVLGSYVGSSGVLEALDALARDIDEPLDLRYTAFTSLQRAGPTPGTLALLRGLSGDETLGPSARALVNTWGGQ